MKKNFLLFAFIGSITAMMYAYQGGAANQGGIDCTNASGAGSGCGGGGCHNSGTDSVKVELDSAGVPVTSYHPGMSYTVKISGKNNSTTTLTYYGFQLAVVNASGAGTSGATDVGTWGSTTGSVQKTTPATSGLPITIVEQSNRINATSGGGAQNSTYINSTPWTAPAAGTGSVKIYGVLNELRSQSTSKYQIAAPITITEAAASAPQAGVAIAITNGTNPTCSGASVTFTATPTNGGTAPTYQWLVNASNAGTGATFTTSSLTNGQSVTCVMTSNLSGVTGSPATSNAVAVTVNTATVPVISQTGGVLTSTSASTYQWQLGGTAISGATSQSYTLTQTGSFTVQITDAHGCSATSAPTVITTLGVSSVLPTDALNIYPNPTTGTLQLNIDQDVVGAEVRIFDYNGKLVYNGKAETASSTLTFEGAAGIYLVQLNKDGKMLTKKIVKL